MRTMDPTEARPVTAEDERIVAPCPSCGAEVARTIPSGTIAAIADLARGMAVTCAACAEREDREIEAKKRAQERELRLERSELPVMLRGVSFESYESWAGERPGAARATANARRWAEGTLQKRGLMLVGPVGVGKTTLAAAALLAALDRMSVRYVNVAELIVKLSAGFGDKDRAQALRILTGRGAIVLDDIDKVPVSMQVLSHLYTAVDNRVQAGAPMIVTTNLEPEALVRMFAKPGRNESPDERRVAAEAIVSRLLGHCVVHAIGGADGRS